MEKKILIVGATSGGSNAVSQIIYRIISSGNEDCVFFLFGFNEGSFAARTKSNVHDILVKNPFKVIFIRALRKIKVLLKQDIILFPTIYTYLLLEQKCRILDPDLIVAVSGRFCYAEAAYLFAKKHNIPLRIVCFDPFKSNTVFYINEKKRESVYSRWIKYSEKIFWNFENVVLGSDKSNIKTSVFKIPIGNVVNENKSDKRSIVYGGSFYGDHRTPEGLYKLNKLLSGTSYHIYCFSNYHDDNSYENLTFVSLVDPDKYSDICNNATAFIYIGNVNTNSISSKYLEYVVYKKPIIGIQVQQNNEVRKYPYYIDMEAEGDHIVSKLTEYCLLDKTDYLPTSTYPDRDPKFIFREFFL